MEYNEYWSQIYEKKDELSSLLSSYWHDYSSIGDWQFWIVAFMFVAPIILLYFIVDRTRILELFFFGYTVHLLWTYIDIALGRNGYVVHTSFLTPYLPNAINLTASVLPVSFLLLYQYCTNRNKNFYLYTLGVCALFSIIFAIMERYLGLVELGKGMTQLFLYLIDVGVVFVAYGFTKVILKASRKGGSAQPSEVKFNLFKQKAR